MNKQTTNHKQAANVGFRESQVHMGVYPGGPTLFWGVGGKKKSDRGK